MSYRCIDLGLTSYRSAYDFQKQCVEEVKSGSVDGFLLLTEHNPVFTLGRFAQKENLLVGTEEAESKGIDVIETNRGGDITFHGPGQLVAYPIFNLSNHHKDVHRYLRELEKVAIGTLADFGLEAFSVKARTGCWMKNGKIASIGIGISRWVTYHGIAINANVDLKFFDMINPCGFKDIDVTSMKEMLGHDIDMEALKEKFIVNFSNIFNISKKAVWQSEQDLKLSHAAVSAI
ncbi:MAG: lipoyl(octanoyl) transferase LipB [Candidatus Omnitrophica bacterium]|nr:lipoyl(octanoyl) transferase LipB [Candidatus Omnitrophota bacterium]